MQGGIYCVHHIFEAVSKVKKTCMKWMPFTQNLGEFVF